VARALLALYGRSGADLGYQVWGKATGGLADSGFAAALGIPTLCGAGRVGGKAHCDGEWCRIVDAAQIFSSRFPLSGREWRGLRSCAGRGRRC